MEKCIQIEQKIHGVHYLHTVDCRPIMAALPLHCNAKSNWFTFGSSCFPGQYNVDEIFVLVAQNVSGVSNYAIFYANTTAKITQYHLNLAVVPQNSHIQFSKNLVYTVMGNIVYKFNYNLVSIGYDTSWTSIINLPRLDVDANSSMTLSFNSTNLVIYDTTRYPITFFNLSTLNLSATISDVRFVKYPFIVILTSDNVLRQFDYFQLQTIVTHQSIQTGVYDRFFYMPQTDLMLLYSSTGSAYMQKYYNNGSYLCKSLFQPDGLLTCANCSTNYIVNVQGQCQKNGYFIPKPVPIVQDNSSTLATTHGKIYPYSNKLSKSVSAFFNSTQFNKSISISARILSLSPIRILPNSFLALTYLFNDLNDYKHHRTIYPEAMQAFMASSCLFNQIKVNPTFFDLVDNVTGKIKDSTGLFQTENDVYMQYMQLSAETDPDKAYFLSSSLNLYTMGLLLCACYFMLMKLLHLIFYLLKLEFNILTFIYDKIRRETMWWIVIVAFYEANFNELTFDCALQLRMPSYFQFENKNNFILASFILFSTLTYSLTFYLSINSLLKNKSSQVLLQRCQQYNTHSFLIQPLLLLFRQVLRSFFNGIFITSYHHQIMFLFSVDMLILAFILKNRKYFRSKLVFLFSLGYLFSVAAIDAYFFIDVHQGEYLPSRQIFSLCSILSMTTFTFLIFVTILGRQLYLLIAFIKQRRRNNNIANDINERQQPVFRKKRMGPILNFPKRQLRMKTEKKSKPMNKLQQSDQLTIRNSNKSILNRSRNIFNANYNSHNNKLTTVDRIKQQHKQQHNCFMVIENKQRKFKQIQFNVY